MDIAIVTGSAGLIAQAACFFADQKLQIARDAADEANRTKSSFLANISRRKWKKSRRRAAPRSTAARERAHAALQANPNASLTASPRSPASAAAPSSTPRDELAGEARKEARKQARKQRETSKPAKPTERPQRAQRFLKDTLAERFRTSRLV